MHCCIHCGKEWVATRGPGSGDLCAGCGQPLHNCIHCGFLDLDRTVCTHPMADQPGDLHRDNDCPMFALVDRRDRRPGFLPDREGPRRRDTITAWNALFH